MQPPAIRMSTIQPTPATSLPANEVTARFRRLRDTILNVKHTVMQEKREDALRAYASASANLRQTLLEAEHDAIRMRKELTQVRENNAIQQYAASTADHDDVLSFILESETFGGTGVDVNATQWSGGSATLATQTAPAT
eukprot:GDKI01016782.1.p1 GENE.GDKI01016782.1~~GDKI01016782.1.p1  ORF type:complete len:152 (+),score=11.54 GDKI01016782.1:40-456(+)